MTTGPIPSPSHILAADYDGVDLVITFASGKYAYHFVDPTDVVALRAVMNARAKGANHISPGRFVNKVIKPNYKFTKLEDAPAS